MLSLHVGKFRLFVCIQTLHVCMFRPFAWMFNLQTCMFCLFAWMFRLHAGKFGRLVGRAGESSYLILRHTVQFQFRPDFVSAGTIVVFVSPLFGIRIHPCQPLPVWLLQNLTVSFCASNDDADRAVSPYIQI